MIRGDSGGEESCEIMAGEDPDELLMRVPREPRPAEGPLADIPDVARLNAGGSMLSGGDEAIVL